MGSAWDELKYIRQAVQLLITKQKSIMSLDEITSGLCPVLSIPQLYRITTMYWDDKCARSWRRAAAATAWRRAAGNGRPWRAVQVRHGNGEQGGAVPDEAENE